MIDTDGLLITKRILPGITNVTTNLNNTITDDGMGKTTNGGINNGKYVNERFLLIIFLKKIVRNK